MSDVDWMDDALCAEIGTEMFFPEEGNPHGVNYAHGKQVCAACPVAMQCLEYALDNEIAEGLWGGVSPRDRARMLSAA